MLARPEVNARIHELGFQLMYELCVDPITCGPMVELLRGEKYEFFSKHLDNFVCKPLPKRSSNDQLRVSSLQQRAWVLKLLALELHVGDMDVIVHRDSCRRLLARLFSREPLGWETGMSLNLVLGRLTMTPTHGNIHNIKVLELLEIIQFQLPDTHDFPSELHSLKEELKVEEIKLSTPIKHTKFPAFYSLAAPSHVLYIRRSNGLNRNRTRTVLTQTSSHNQPRNHDLAFTLTTKPLVILKRHAPSWAMMATIVFILERGE
jgi:nuclear pore complex protein Nup205